MPIPPWLRSDEAPLTAKAQQREYRAIAARIAAERHGRVLDWGCGHGQVTDLLARAGVDVEAFDYGGDGAPNAPVTLPHFPRLSAYVSSDPVNLPYSDDSFSAVLSCGVLEHVQDPDASLEEIKRVLEPGGTFYVFKLPNRRSYLERIARTTGLDYHGQSPYDRLYTLTSARELFHRHGFEVAEARYANMLPLTVGGRLANGIAGLTWSLNKALSAVPVLNRFATNVEAVTHAPR
jgi:ubiquinone/menaquinone biosynthesis C-methylase UbiE